MTTALVVDGGAPAALGLAADLTAVGIHVLGAASSSNLVHEAIRLAPDVIVGHDARAGDALFDACTRLAATAPCAVAIFTSDPDAAKIERALSAGIHAYVVNGYGLNRLRSVLQLAQARFAHERALRDALVQVRQRFDERKLVDRAKGILMRARHVSEDEAFRTLRTASMHSQQRVGQVSQQVIAAAHYADAVNRAGKLRMLSQRLVKLAALQFALPAASGTAAALGEAIAQIDASLVALGKSLSKATFGDLLDAVEATWPPLRALAEAPALRVAQLPALDALAEQLLERADQLTRHLETAGLVTTLHVINVSGRQRMWSQRFAKQALLALLLDGDAARRVRDDLTESSAAFEQALAYLRAIPLTTREIRELLEHADATWRTLQAAAAPAPGGAGSAALSEASDALLALFEQLTDCYERSMQVLMG